MNLYDIDTDTEEGKLLIAAIAALTVSKEISLNGKEYNGRRLTPYQVLRKLKAVVKIIFPDIQNTPDAIRLNN